MIFVFTKDIGQNINSISSPFIPAQMKETTQAFLEINEERLETTIEGKENVYDFMMKLQEEGKMSFKDRTYSGMGKLVEEINGLKNSGEKNWIYYINGKKANIGVSNYKINKGDIVSWKYEKVIKILLVITILFLSSSVFAASVSLTIRDGDTFILPTSTFQIQPGDTVLTVLNTADQVDSTWSISNLQHYSFGDYINASQAPPERLVIIGSIQSTILILLIVLIKKFYLTEMLYIYISDHKIKLFLVQII